MTPRLSRRTGQLVETMFNSKDAGNTLSFCDSHAAEFGYDINGYEAWAEDVLRKS